ncbi:hypothetical protein M1O12_01840 [Dehalococcoidia bacterium]|nr:hypothetical protein [Dehalococcoidia bacterium]
MRLSKTSWLILGVGIFLIAFGGLYMLYARQSRELQQVEASLLVAQAALPGAVSEKEDRASQLSQLESRLARSESELVQAESLLHKAAAKFPESVESIEYGEALFAIAKEHDLKITTLIPSRPADKTVEGVTFSVTFFAVDVVGEVADILDFISTIAVGDEDFASARLELVDIVFPEPVEENVEGTENSSASIRLAIYGYQ